MPDAAAAAGLFRAVVNYFLPAKCLNCAGVYTNQRVGSSSKNLEDVCCCRGAGEKNSSPPATLIHLFASGTGLFIWSRHFFVPYAWMTFGTFGKALFNDDAGIK